LTGVSSLPSAAILARADRQFKEPGRALDPAVLLEDCGARMLARGLALDDRRAVRYPGLSLTWSLP
jgi:hypothetical protein